MDGLDAHQTQFNNHAFSLNDDVILQSTIHTLIEKCFTPSLTRLRQVVGTSKLFQFSLHNDQQSLHGRPFSKHNFVVLFVLYLHPLEEGLLVPLQHCEKVSVFLDYMLDVVFKHHLPEIRPDYLGESLPSEHLAYEILLGPHSHLPHSVIIQGVMSKALSFVNLPLFQIAL